MCWMDLMISWSAPATPFDARLIILLPLPCPLLLLVQVILFLLPFRLLVYLLLNRVQFVTRRFQIRSFPPGATLEVWSSGFQTGRGLGAFLPRPALVRS